MRILSIETSCDDTSIALLNIDGRLSDIKRGVAPKIEVISNIISSQTAIHRHWGGVVPNLAKREHIKNLPKIFKSLHPTPYTLHPDLISVTVGPGLEPALWTGIEFAKKLSAKLKVPLVGANHLEGHLYSFILPPATNYKLPTTNFPAFPAIALLVSGGHTMLLHMKDLLHWEKLGETRDDAVGECFDKVARMMNLPYPGGPEIEKLALRQAQDKPENPRGTIIFPRPMMREKSYDFSFSGLKTSVLYYLRNHNLVPERGRKAESKDDNNVSLRQAVPTGRQAQGITDSDVCASFQWAAVETLATKAFRAVNEFGAKSLFLCGGVAANRALREELSRRAGLAGIEFKAPEFEYNTDNAAMIAVAAYMRKISRRKSYPMEADSTISL